MNIRPFQNTTPQLGNAVYVDESAVVIGDVVLGDDCSVWPQAVIRGDMHRIRIGQRTSIQDGSILHITHAIVMDGAVIEDEVIIGANALVSPGKHLESGFLYVGSPCKPARPLTEKEKSFFLYTTANYVKLKDQYRQEQ